MICVLIERLVEETLLEHYEKNAKNILQHAVQIPGFISGEALRDVDNHHKRVIWTKWRSAADWQAWQNSEQRKEMIINIQALLVGDEKITLLEHS
jgi:heme-degrading monooxygenase HmoA